MAYTKCISQKSAWLGDFSDSYNPGSLDSLSQLSTPGPIQPIEIGHSSHKRLMYTSTTCIIICNQQEATILSLPLQTSKAIPADREHIYKSHMTIM